MFEPAIIIARTINEYLTVIFDKAGNIIDSVWYPEKKMGKFTV